jgi:hypothetical protein
VGGGLGGGAYARTRVLALRVVVVCEEAEGGGGSSATGVRGAAGKERVGAGGKRGRALTRVRAAQTRDGVGMCIVCLHAWLSSFPLLFAFMLVMLRAAQAILLN